MNKNFFLILMSLSLIIISKAQGAGANGNSGINNNAPSGSYIQDSTRELVSLVKKATDLVRRKGEKTFNDFRSPGSRWRNGDVYIFVLDLKGNMLVHADPGMEGRNQLDLKDINGKPIIRGLIEAATTPGKPGGWYHYQWPVPGGILPRWKSSFVQSVKAPSGESYIVGCGMYNDHMEREFVVDVVKAAATKIEKDPEEAFRIFHDPKSPFIAKDAYVFVIDTNGVDLVNPAFPNLEGRNLMDLKDTRGKQLVREMFKIVQSTGSGWVDYMWPKPGESVSTQKSAYVIKTKYKDQWVMVGCGVYLADAPKEISTTKKMTASELMNLVRDAAQVFEQQGEKAFPGFREKGSKWFHDDAYFFVWTIDGVRSFHAANPEGEGLNMRDVKDVLGRQWGKMLLGAGTTPTGEGWFHYMYPEPGDIFPTWKSSFVKRVTFPSGKDYMIGCGIYNMQMDKTFIEDVVNQAAAIIAAEGTRSFDQLRDKTGPFMFMDTYVFVDSPDGVELVNGAQPSFEGMNLMDVKDAYGKYAARDYIREALKDGSAWVDYWWYRPGANKLAHKYTYVRKVQHANETFIVGAGIYVDDKADLAGILKE